MFPERIAQTAFTDPDVNAAFPKIRCDNVMDAVFASVMRAVLPSRMGEDDSCNLKYRENDLSLSSAGDYEYGTVLNHIFGSIPTMDHMLTIVNLSRQNDPHANTWEKFTEKFNGWERIERVTEFFKSSFQVICWTNETLKSTIVMIGRADLMRVHYVACSLPALIPWFFPKEKGLSEDERALFMSLRKRQATDFKEILARFEAKFDFYTIKLESLGSFENEWMQDELRQEKLRIEEIRNRIESRQRDIETYLREMENASIRVFGLEAKMNDESAGELREYFIENKNRVRLAERGDSTLTFEVMTNMAYWDEDMAETLYENKRSYIYTARGSMPRMKSEDFAKLFKAIFLDQSLTLRFCAAYKIAIRDRAVHGVQGYHYGSECIGFFPNPHIDRYECLGAYRQALNAMMETHNYLGIMEQCAVSAASFNLNDTTVLEEFCKRLYACNEKVILLPDGTAVTPCDAVEFLNGGKEKEDENGEEN